MKHYKKCYELKNTAKDKLDGKYILAISVCLTSVSIEYAVSLFIGSFLPSPIQYSGISVPAYVVNGIFSLALNWVLGVMRLGTSLFFLNMACGHPYKLTDLFYGYKNDSTRALIVSGVYTLLSAVCQMPGQYLVQAFFYTHDRNLFIAGAAATAAGLCILLPVSAGISLSFYLLLDFPNKSAREVLLLSFRIMNGHKRRWLYMTFSFLPLIVLCVLSIYIGFLWLMPYMQMTYACFFLDIMNPKETA